MRTERGLFLAAGAAALLYTMKAEGYCAECEPEPDDLQIKASAKLTILFLEATLIRPLDNGNYLIKMRFEQSADTLRERVALLIAKGINAVVSQSHPSCIECTINSLEDIVAIEKEEQSVDNVVHTVTSSVKRKRI